MERKFNYVYLTTNLVNGKQYIGDHSTDKINDYDFTISCNFDLIKPLDDVAKDMGLSLNDLKDELNTITKARIDFAEKQCESQGFDLDRSSKKYLI